MFTPFLVGEPLGRYHDLRIDATDGPVLLQPPPLHHGHSSVERLSKPQSYVAKYEKGERRLDVVEFMEVAEPIGFDAAEFLRL